MTREEFVMIFQRAGIDAEWADYCWTKGRATKNPKDPAECSAQEVEDAAMAWKVYGDERGF